jgi:hypothetical protein
MLSRQQPDNPGDNHLQEKCFRLGCIEIDFLSCGFAGVSTELSIIFAGVSSAILSPVTALRLEFVLVMTYVAN